ncbi:MAG: hypothetical protein K8F31_08545, partial [Roseovarius sp.]|nr:hypothetical protein [Roseovarius sp.]
STRILRNSELPSRSYSARGPAETGGWNPQRPPTATPQANPATTPGLADAQALQRSLVGLLANASGSQRSLNSSPQPPAFNPLSAARQAMAQASVPPRRSTPPAALAAFHPAGRIYTVKKSGTRAEGMALRVPVRKAARPRTDSPLGKADPAPSRSRLSLRTIFPQNSIPRPSRGMMRGAAMMAQGAETPSPVAVKARLLTSGIAVFLAGPSRLRVMTVPTRSVIYNPRMALLSPRVQAYILQISVPPGFRQALVRLMHHPLFQWHGLRALFARLFAGLLRGNGAPQRGRMDRDFLAKLLRMRLRKRRLNKMNRKRVRRVSANISRAVGKTKTADLKSYY